MDKAGLIALAGVAILAAMPFQPEPGKAGSGHIRIQSQPGPAKADYRIESGPSPAELAATMRDPRGCGGEGLPSVDWTTDLKDLYEMTSGRRDCAALVEECVKASAAGFNWRF